MKKRLGGILAALALAAVPTLAFVQPAAAAIDTKICNSSDSTDHNDIAVHPLGTSAYYVIHHGDCGPWLSNSNDNLIVDTCWEDQVFSYYQIKPEGGSYGPKHYGCNHASNPPDVNSKVYYKMMN